MTTVKTISGDYVITCANGTGNVTINADLAVNGNITYVSELAVDDAFIIIAANNTGATTSMGLIAQKSTTTYAGLRFNSVVSSWELSPNVDANGNPISPYQTISTGNYGNVEVSAYLAAGTNTANIVTTGNVSARTVITTPVPLANLTAVAGSRAFVSDGNLAATGNFGAQIGSGGSNVVPVWSNGTNWYIG
jgi:hypothetical protein